MRTRTAGFWQQVKPDDLPPVQGAPFLSVDEEELTGPDWVQLGNRAVDEERPTDALACYQQAAALDDMLGVTNLGWCLEAGIGVPWQTPGRRWCCTPRPPPGTICPL